MMAEKKILAFIVKILLQIITRGDRSVSENDAQQLENIAYDLGVWELKDDEFRY